MTTTKHDRAGEAGALAFPPETYRQRLRAVCESMAHDGLDLLYVTSPVNLRYLTGYVSNWYPPRLPVGVVVERSSERAILFEWSRRIDYASARCLCDALFPIDYGSAPRTIANIFARLSWAGLKIGVEYVSPTPVTGITNALVDALKHGGARVASGDWIVDNIRLYKEAEEVNRLREAAAIADAAMRQIVIELSPGMTPLEISVRMSQLLVNGGSEYAALPPIVSAGPEGALDVHAPASRRPIKVGDVVGIDCCSVVDGYHAALARSFLIGGGDHVAREWLATADEAARILCAGARRGEGTETALSAAQAHLGTVIAEENIWWIGGYPLGLGSPPSWVGHAYLANDGPVRCCWEPGFVANYETIFVDPVEGFVAEAIDTIIMTDDGLDMLSTLPRTLITVPA